VGTPGADACEERATRDDLHRPRDRTLAWRVQTGPRRQGVQCTPSSTQRVWGKRSTMQTKRLRESAGGILHKARSLTQRRPGREEPTLAVGRRVEDVKGTTHTSFPRESRGSVLSVERRRARGNKAASISPSTIHRRKLARIDVWHFETCAASTHDLVHVRTPVRSRCNAA
jgi:hypothetical protein